MPEDPPLPPAARAATAQRPLAGLTILLVEDSRFASEAVRLLCLRSGARIRRADCLQSAHRHLRTYRPEVAIIDLGLPDGAGETLIADLAQTRPRVRVILGLSGDDTGATRALAAGADGFLAKPLSSLAAFQQAILAHLPDSPGLRIAPPGEVTPDAIALRDDLQQAADILKTGPDEETLDYLAQFLGGLARAAADPVLADAALGLATRHRQGPQALARLSHLVEDRLTGTGPL